jgi:hypothetical protein
MGCGGSKNVSVVESHKTQPQPAYQQLKNDPVVSPKRRAVEPADSMISVRKSVVNLKQAVEEKPPSPPPPAKPEPPQPEPAQSSEENDAVPELPKTGSAAPDLSKPKYSVAADDVVMTYEECAKTTPETIEEMWNLVGKTSSQSKVELYPTTNRKGWKTIRVFVSSTFKDFHQEREVLVKEVFPDLRLWCEKRKLRLVECDLRWGVPKDTTGEETITICLNELDRCCSDNVVPVF